MLTSLAGNSFLILAVLVFVAVMLLLESLYVMWRSHRGPEAKKLQVAPARAVGDAATAPRRRSCSSSACSASCPLLERYLQSLPRMRGLDRVILQSGLNWTVSKLLAGLRRAGRRGMDRHRDGRAPIHARRARWQAPCWALRL